jgi:predicted HicB family RNase H-like nuclease
MLQETINDMGAGDAITVKAKIEEFRRTENDLKNSCEEIRAIVKQLQKESADKKNEIMVFDEIILLESFALYQPKFKFQTSLEYKTKLDAIREKQKELIKSGDAVSGNTSWTVNGSQSEGRKMVNDMTKLLLRSFNNECDYCVDNVKFNNIEANEKRIEKSFEQCNKLGRIMNAKISDQYKKLKYDELHLAFE